MELAHISGYGRPILDCAVCSHPALLAYSLLRRLGRRKVPNKKGSGVHSDPVAPVRPNSGISAEVTVPQTTCRLLLRSDTYGLLSERSPLINLVRPGILPRLPRTPRPNHLRPGAAHHQGLSSSIPPKVSTVCQGQTHQRHPPGWGDALHALLLVAQVRVVLLSLPPSTCVLIASVPQSSLLPL